MIVESDSRMAVSLTSKGELLTWEGGCMDILDFASTCESYLFEHINKKANTILHNVAKDILREK